MPQFDWIRLKRVCEQLGWRYDRNRGSHYIMVKDGAARPIVIPRKANLSMQVIAATAQTLGLPVKELSSRLLTHRVPKRKQKKKQKKQT